MKTITVAWICALLLEMAAATAMLDETHLTLLQAPTDHNTYKLGKIYGHHVVIPCLPSGIYGTTSAAAVASQMQSTFPAIQFGLIVGIGGGVPRKGADIRLGDIVVSKPTGSSPGQYDYGKTVRGGEFEQTGVLNQPPQVLLSAIAQLQSSKMVKKSQDTSKILVDALTKNPDMKSEFSSPGPQHDRLFQANYDHPNPESDCTNCDNNQIVNREPRASDEPQVHYGLIASGPSHEARHDA